MRLRWPWCSVYWRDAYERERAIVRDLTDALLRIQRKEMGLPETPAKPREVVTLPANVDALCGAWGSKASREAARVRAFKLYEQFKDWDRVYAEMTPDTEGE